MIDRGHKMAPNTRNFLIGSAVVVVAGLCTGLVAYYSGALPGRDTARTEFSYISSDVSAVAFADVREIMDSPFSHRVREIMPTGADKNRLLEETGIDIERDIDTVVAGLTSSEAQGALVVMRGRFDQSRIEALAMQHGARAEQYGGRAMLVGVSQAHGTAEGEPTDYVPSLAFLEGDLLAIGDASALRKSIDVAAGGQDVASNADMMRFISTVQGSGNAWLVGRAGQMTNQPQIPELVRSQLQDIEWLSVSADMDRDLRGLVRAEARDEAGGQQLRTLLAGTIAAARIFGEQDVRLAAALNSMQVAGTGRNVELSFEVSAGLLELLNPATAPDATLPAPIP
jgi:hypothetical protein